VNGLYDLGVTTNRLHLEGSQLKIRVVDQAPAVCVMSLAHRFSGDSYVGPRHFKSETLLTLDREDDLTDGWRSVLSQAGVTPTSIIETTYSATICRLAQAGAGIGVVNPYVASVFSDMVRIVPLKPPIGVKVFVAYPAHVAMSSLATMLMQQISSHFKQKPRSSGKR